MIAQALLASTAIILLSFISEDAATISSSLSIFGGPISWPLGFAACFAGIWLGDLGLYSLARCFGKPILKSRWLARFADATAIERCQIRFNNHASLTLLASRFVPGTRLPTYLAAGLLSMPVTQFAAVTAFGALLWIAGIFVIAKLLGSHTLIWFSLSKLKLPTLFLLHSFLAPCCFVQKTHPRASLGEALDTLGILAGMAVLHSCGRLLFVAGDSLSRLGLDCSESRNRDRRIHRGIEV